jgi:uncharacterized protein (DUF2147 family)
MNGIIARAALVLLGVATPVSASASATIEGHWANPHHTVIVNVTRCGSAYCGIVSWSNARNREKGTTPGIRVLSDLRPDRDGTYRGNAYEPKHQMHGSAVVRQLGPDVMMVKGCALLGLVCSEQRWTRVS